MTRAPAMRICLNATIIFETLVGGGSRNLRTACHIFSGARGCSLRKEIEKGLLGSIAYSALFITLLIAAATGCSGSSQLPAVDYSPATQQGLLAQLPALPIDAAADREAEGTSIDTLYGADTWDISDGAIIDGSRLILPADSYQVEYAMYRYVIPLIETGTECLTADLSILNDREAWIAVSDYVSGCWAIHGPFIGEIDIPLNMGRYISETGNCYVVVIAYNGATVEVDSTSLAYDNGVRD